jgi:hypothetical protein
MGVPGLTSRGGATTTRRLAALLGAGVVGLLPLIAAPAMAARDNGPIVGQAVMHDVSPPLRDLAPLSGGEEDEPGPPRDLLENRPTHAHGPGAAVVDPVVQATAPTADAPSTAANFAGVGNLDGVYPPDTNGDVGPNHYVQWVNLHFAIYSKTGSMVYGPAAGNTLWSGFGNPCQTQNGGDPIVLYDQFAGRWVMAQFTTTKPYGECVAVSTTSDPTGTWNRYFFQFSTRVFYDYPKIGVWPDGYYLTANRFGGAFGIFQGASAIALDRSAMLAGQPAAFQEFQTSSGYGSLLPADVDGSTPPPAGAPAPIVEVGSSALHTWRFHVDWANPANSALAGPSSTSVAAYNELCPATRSCIPQPGTSVGLDGLGDRLMYRLAYRNFGDHESLVVNHSVDVDGGSGIRAGIRWYEIRNATSGTPSLAQQGTFSPDATNRWMGSVAMDGAGNIALGYSVASSSLYAGIRVTGRLAADTPGQMTQGETTIVAGSGSQTGSASRWGDYASMSVDPTDDCTFWFTTEYMPSTGPAPWATRIASFTLPGCSPATVQKPGAPTNLQATAGDASVHLSWAAPQTGDPATGYKVYRDGGTTPVATLGSVLAWDDAGLTNGRTYSYEVTATNAAGDGPAAGPVWATPQATPATVPGAPANVHATAGDTVVDLSWSAPADDGGSAITGYVVYRDGTEVGSPAGTSFHDSGLTNGTTYGYTVAAVNGIGTGPQSSPAVDATPQAAPTVTAPSAPQDLTASPAKGKGVQLGWSAPASDGGSAITEYRIYRDGTLLATVSGSTTGYKDTSTSRGATYSYEVSAFNGTFEGPRAGPVTATSK